MYNVAHKSKREGILTERGIKPFEWLRSPGNQHGQGILKIPGQSVKPKTICSEQDKGSYYLFKSICYSRRHSCYSLLKFLEMRSSSERIMTELRVSIHSYCDLPRWKEKWEGREDEERGERLSWEGGRGETTCQVHLLSWGGRRSNTRSSVMYMWVMVLIYTGTGFFCDWQMQNMCPTHTVLKEK